MGIYNSSETRVKPLGNAILNDHNLVDKILSIIMPNEPVSFGSFDNNKDVFFTGHNKEKSLSPTQEHLLAIIDKIITDESFREHVKKKDKSSSTNKLLRGKLFELDPETLGKAKCHFETWNKFERPSYPDLFVENENNILIIEGKRTEKDITKKTTYLEHRSQMIRHIENALSYCHCKKQVIAFYIIEENCHYKNLCTKSYLKKSFAEETIKKDTKLRNEICNCFYGYTTWQEIAKVLNIEYPM